MPNDYEMIYVREMQDFLEKSKMVAVFQAQVRFKWKWHTAWQNARRYCKETQIPLFESITFALFPYCFTKVGVEVMNTH